VLYRKVPKTGDALSILGYGCMRLPTKRGGIDETRARAQLHRAIDRGVNYVDTAMPYHGGASESFLGRALAGGYRDRVRIATKLPPWSVRRREDMEQLLRAQLDKLATDRIDYYLVHGLDGRNWPKMERLGVLEFLDRARKSGQIVNAGFSFHGDRDVFREIVDAYPWEVCQIQYNYLDEQYQAGTDGLEYAASKGLGVVVMEPLRGGNLASPVPREVEALWAKAPERRSPAEWALRWVWDHPQVTSVLSGMNDERHIDENLRVASAAEAGALGSGELELIGAVRDTYRRLMEIGCTGCRYCMPCPKGVDIPACFDVYNNVHLFGGRGGRLKYAFRVGLGDPPAFASRCERCGACVKKCPQELPIPDHLEAVVRDLEGPWSRPFIWTVEHFMSFQRWSALRAARRSVRR
jgi:uncharacterized protein